jgi:hypothetical protein
VAVLILPGHRQHDGQHQAEVAGVDVRRAARDIPGRPDPRVGGPLVLIGDNLAATARPHADSGQVQARGNREAARCDQDLAARQLQVPLPRCLDLDRTAGGAAPADVISAPVAMPMPSSSRAFWMAKPRMISE